MVLPGMRLTVLLGYFCGVYFIARPWGDPRFKWFSLPTFLLLFILPSFVFFNIEIIYHHQDKLTHVTKFDPDRVDHLVTIISFAEIIIASVSMRLVFLLKARKISELLGRFRKYSKVRLDWHGASTNADLFVCFLVFLSTFSVGVADGLDCYYHGIGQSWIREWLGPLIHCLAITILFVMPMMIPILCAFALIVSFTGYLSIIFQDYCKHILDLIHEQKYSGMSIVMHETVDKKSNVNVEKIKGSFTEKLRKEIINRFEIIREVYDDVHQIISPMAMVLLAASCIAVVMKAYELVILKKNSLLMVRDICHLLNYVSYYWILQCGQRLADKIDEMKVKLDDIQAELSSDIHILEKQTVKDVQKVIKLWNWKFTAFDIFVIDRGLGSGVVSLIMTYVVVLVQLKVSDAPNTVE